MRVLQLFATATAVLAQDQFSHNTGNYHYNNAGVFWFWLFFIVIIMIVFFGIVGGVYNFGGHAHTVHIGLITDKDADGHVTHTRRVEETTTTIADDSNYGYATYGGVHHGRYDALYGPSVSRKLSLDL